MFGVDLGPGGETRLESLYCSRDVSANPGSRGVCLALCSNPPFPPQQFRFRAVSSGQKSRGMPNLCLNDRISARFTYMTIAHPYNSGRGAAGGGPRPRSSRDDHGAVMGRTSQDIVAAASAPGRGPSVVFRPLAPATPSIPLLPSFSSVIQSHAIIRPRRRCPRRRGSASLRPGVREG